MKTLDELCIYYGADKSPKLAHSYAPKYDELFSDRRDKVKNILEVGIGYSELMEQYANWNHPEPLVIYTVGASLYAWRDYFQNAQVWGIDVDQRAQIVGQERIKTYLADATDEPSVAKILADIPKLDIVIDDGSHIPEDQIATARLLLPHMKKGGLYCIEDIENTTPLEFEFSHKDYEIFDWAREGYTNDRIFLIRC